MVCNSESGLSTLDDSMALAGMAQPCEWVTQGDQGVAVEVGERSIHAGGHVTLCNGAALHNGPARRHQQESGDQCGR